MSTAQVAETSVAEIVKANEPPKTDYTIVTNDNFHEYVNERLGVTAKKADGEPLPGADDLEGKAAAEAEKLKADAKAARGEDEEEIEHPEPSKKDKLNARFSELTKARKEAEAKAAAAAKQAQEASEAREKAEREAAELRQKYEPPKPDELGPEPQPEQFSDVKEYAQAIKEWTADKTLRDAAAKEAQARETARREQMAKEWGERQDAARKELADYDQKLNGSTVKVSDQMRDAIVESEVGPHILYHFAENPEVAEKLGKMTVARMLKEMGKLEATIAAKQQKPDPKTEKQTAPSAKNVAELSKAPAPITPLSGVGTPVTRLSGGDEVPRNMTYEDWKALRKAGKIK